LGSIMGNRIVSPTSRASHPARWLDMPLVKLLRVYEAVNKLRYIAVSNCKWLLDAGPGKEWRLLDIFIVVGIHMDALVVRIVKYLLAHSISQSVSSQ
jgi:hypothetical protein